MDPGGELGTERADKALRLEIELVRRTALLQDAAMEHVRNSIRPGRMDFEILAAAEYYAIMQ